MFNLFFVEKNRGVIATNCILPGWEAKYPIFPFSALGPQVVQAQYVSLMKINIQSKNSTLIKYMEHS